MLYPSWANVAAADAPARPEPTTIIVCFRLFAGFTSFRLNRCRSHRVSIGPLGALESSSITLSSAQHTCKHRYRYRNIADRDQNRAYPCEPLQYRGGPWIRKTHRLKHAPQPVVQMHA